MMNEKTTGPVPHPLMVMLHRESKNSKAQTWIPDGWKDFLIRKYGSTVALVDDEDYELVAPYKWHIHKRKHRLYARGELHRRGKKVLMHRLILGVVDPRILADHRNNDGLDNRRFNLRVCTNQQNLMNQRSFRGTSRFKGVSRRGRKWRAYIMVSAKQIQLGRFEDEIDAARAYDRAAIQYFGEFARPNFPCAAHLVINGEAR